RGQRGGEAVQQPRAVPCGDLGVRIEGGQQVREGTERQPGGGLVAGRPGHVPPAGRGGLLDDPKALQRGPGLAHTGRTGQDEPARAARGEKPPKPPQLLGAPREGPRGLVRHPSRSRRSLVLTRRHAVPARAPAPSAVEPIPPVARVPAPAGTSVSTAMATVAASAIETVAVT